MNWHSGLFILFGFGLLVSSCTPETPAGAGADWAHYLGDPSSNQYSTLNQINTENVHELELAWTYDTGDSAMYQTNNLIADGVLYTLTPERRVVALDAASGTEIWTFDPNTYYEGQTGGTQRGLMYWDGGSEKHVFATLGPWFYALDAATGDLVTSFGDDGWVHLGDGMDIDGRPNVGFNTPGYIYNDMIIAGTRVGEDVPGAIRAFDVRTGERKWIFHTLPRPGEFGSETWPEGYFEKTGGASDWSGIAIDVERGMVYASTETAGPDFWGGDRYGENLFANSVIALDADTGERIWHQQLVHHDLWDMDLPTPPTLLTVTHEGQEVDVVAQGTKMGLLFVFDRVTGKPLWPIEERPVPETEIPEIKTWPTQPFPTRPEPLMRQRYTEDDYSDISPRARQLTMDGLAQSGNFGAYPPPSLEQSIIFPGYDGGMEWGGSAADPEGIVYVNVNEIPWFYQLIPTSRADGTPLPFGERQYRINCASCHGLDRAGNPAGGFPSLVDISRRMTKEAATQIVVQGGGRMPAYDQLREDRRQAIIDFLFGDEGAEGVMQSTEFVEPNNTDDEPPYVFRGFQRWFDDEGYPAIKPPWGTLNAVDLNTGYIKWKVPLGEYPELTARGIPPTGTENYGGPVVTAGGLVFIGASADGMVRAFDKETGETLWEHEVPFDANATPSTYWAEGRQYVVFSAGGAKTNRPKGGLLIAFALPQ